jgi:RNA polymerase sigma-70 factor (ECF subfamily)
LDRTEPEANKRFYEQVWPHAPTVLRTAQFLVHDSTEAEDLAQEAMLRAFRGLASFREGTDMRAWLMTILRNTRIDRLRSRAGPGRTISFEQLPAEPEDKHPQPAGGEHPAWDRPQELLDGFSDHQIILAMQDLPEDMRWTLLLVDVEGLEYQEAAHVMGVPVGTAKSRAHRARAMLRQALLPIAKALHLID